MNLSDQVVVLLKYPFASCWVHATTILEGCLIPTLIQPLHRGKTTSVNDQELCSCWSLFVPGNWSSTPDSHSVIPMEMEGSPECTSQGVQKIFCHVQSVQLSGAVSVPSHCGGPCMMSGVYSCNATPPAIIFLTQTLKMCSIFFFFPQTYGCNYLNKRGTGLFAR